jgi:serine/threonine protein kinase
MEEYLLYVISISSILLLFLIYILNKWRLKYLAYLQKQIRKKWKNSHYNSLRGNFVVIYDTPIEEKYHVNKEKILGQGSFGVVMVGINKETGIKYAIKFINKSSCDDVKRLEREVKLLKDVDHLNIVGLFAVYETIEHVGFVMELCTGGHLGRYLEKLPNKHAKEDHARSIIRQLLSAIAHMHARGICHRDIKLQNILMENQSMNSQIKLIDFGFGTRFIGATPLKTRCGTPYTTAPEVFQESYDERCDLWSAGVVAYITICGKRPFQALVLPGELENAGKASLVTNILMCRSRSLPPPPPSPPHL